jgi:membrane protein DedA with SNARE-associated domain
LLAVLCATGQATVTHVIGVAILACLVADVAWFYVGQRRGKTVLAFLPPALLTIPGSSGSEPSVTA